MSFEIVWHPGARRDLLDINWQDAAWVVREINRLADDGVGDVRAETLQGDRALIEALASKK